MKKELKALVLQAIQKHIENNSESMFKTPYSFLDDIARLTEAFNLLFKDEEKSA